MSGFIVCPEKIANFAHRFKGISSAAVAQSVEHQLPKLRVASSSLVCRSIIKALKIRF